MNGLIINPEYNVCMITLKEITDLIGVQHSKAMKKVDKLVLEPSFGGVAKTATPTFNPDKSFNKNIETYHLTKKQAIAVGAKLNNSLLMKVIDKIEELENDKSEQNKVSLPNNKQLALMVIEAEEKIEKHQKTIANTIHSKNSYTATQIAKDLNISAKLFNKILTEAGVQYKLNNTFVLTSKYQSYNLTDIKEVVTGKNKMTRISLRWTVVGKNWIMKNWDNALQRCNKETFKQYNKIIDSILPKIPMPKKSNRNSGD